METTKICKPGSTTIKKAVLYLLSILLWMVLWQIAAVKLSKELFLPTPIKVFSVLLKDMIPSKEFWFSIKTSLFNIGTGFLAGTALGIFLAVLSSISEAIKIFLWFPMKIIKSIPVASFTILTLLWLPSKRLSIFIPFLMVLPVLYINTLTGISQADKKVLEMARVFHVPLIKKIIFIYIPYVMPYILSSCSIAVGMAWKSGIAAEIIGLAKNSIGNQLYQSKIYLMIPELFAWTITIVILSISCEQFIKFITHMILKKKGNL